MRETGVEWPRADASNEDIEARSLQRDSPSKTSSKIQNEIFFAQTSIHEKVQFFH